MPKQIPPETKKLLHDESWLYQQHVINCYGIAELARKLHITPAVVRKAIRRHNIPSPTQQQLREASNLRKHGVKNPGQVDTYRKKAYQTMEERYGGHIWKQGSEGRKKSLQTKHERYGNSIASKTEHVKQKISHSKLNDKYTLLNDKQWLCDQHYNQNKSLSEISKQLQVSWATVLDYFKRHSVQTRDTSFPITTEQCLHDYQWLYDQHVTQRKPFTTIAKELGIQDDTVRRYANKLHVPVLQHSTLSDDTFQKLSDPEWLYEQCVIQLKSYKHLAEELNICSVTVADYCQQANVIPAQQNRKINNNVLQKLEDKDWLYDQHINQQKSSVHIGYELSIHPTSVQNYFKKHNIPVHLYNHSTGEKQVFI